MGGKQHDIRTTLQGLIPFLDEIRCVTGGDYVDLAEPHLTIGKIQRNRGGGGGKSGVQIDVFMQKAVCTGRDGVAGGIIRDGIFAVFQIEQQIQRADSFFVFQRNGRIAGGGFVAFYLLVEQK